MRETSDTKKKALQTEKKKKWDKERQGTVTRGNIKIQKGAWASGRGGGPKVGGDEKKSQLERGKGGKV